MQEHVHTGPYQLVISGVAALIFFNLLRLIAVGLAGYPKWEWLAKAIGGLITFNASSETVA